MEKTRDSARQAKTSGSSRRNHNEEGELPNFELNLLNEPPAKRFANFSEQELNKLVAERSSQKTKKTTNWSEVRTYSSSIALTLAGPTRRCTKTVTSHKSTDASLYTVPSDLMFAEGCLNFSNGV